MVLSLFVPKTTGFCVELDNETVFMKVENQEKTLTLSEGTHTVSITDQMKQSLAGSMLLDILRLPFGASDAVSDKTFRFSLAKEEMLTLVIRYGEYSEIEFHYDDSFTAMAKNLVSETVCSERQNAEKKASRLNKLILCIIGAGIFTVAAVSAWLGGTAPIAWRVISSLFAVALWILFAVSVCRKNA